MTFLKLVALGAVLATAPGCASALVNAEGALTRTIAVTQDTANATCDAGIQDAASCKQFNIRLVPVISGAKAFNLAAQENSYAEVPAMMSAVMGLRDAVVEFFQDPILQKAIKDRIEGLWSQMSRLKGAPQ